MRGPAATLFVAAALVGCTREPRSSAYFEAHPEQATRVAAACIDGKHGGPECANAKAALAGADRKARMARYRHNF